MKKSIITGMGYYVPENIVKNADLEKIMETNNEWIIERTGIEERRWIPENSTESTAEMGTKAARKAIADAGLEPKDIDFIIFATLSPDYFFPGSGVIVQKELGIGTIGALDVRNQCSGFIYALSIADLYVKTGQYKNVLVIGAEHHSGGLDKTTRGRGVSVIFGDGAGAAIVSATTDENRGILSTHLHSEGQYAEELMVKAPAIRHWVPQILAEEDKENDESYYPYMNGNFVFKHAIQRFSEVIMEALNHNHYKPEDIKLLVPHQANLRIAQYVQKQFQLTDNQVYNNIMRYGNTTAASIPIALAEAKEKGLIQKGDLVCLAAFGSGFTWASALLKW